MATGIVITVAANLLAKLHSEELREICSMSGYESQLDDLKVRVSTIKSILLDLESKLQVLTQRDLDFIPKLKKAVYLFDDVVDEFNTNMVLKKNHLKSANISKEVGQFFSLSIHFLVSFDISFRTEQLRSNLDDLAKDHPQFGFSDMYVPTKEKLETMSVDAENGIIGRETDKEAIVEMLLGDSESSNNVGRNISFVTIVGIGGIGKSELATLVYEDDRIEKAFDLMLWVYVSNDFDLEKIFRQMLKRDALEWYDIKHLQRAVRNLIEGKRFLIVLDNTWNERCDEWENLKSILELGMKGSRVVITSRSKIIANVVGDDPVYELKGLSEENSWNLFKRLAFEQGKEPMNSNDDHLFDIGKEIVKKCDNVPLAIRVVASMLYGQDESKWLSFKNANLIEMRLGMTDVMSILKYSYYHLTPALRSCFSYCAFFPKDYFIEKELLIRLWMAHGCLDEPLDSGNKEDVGEEYFSILLHRCFLQGVITDIYGEIKYCMMHDLIHDLAKEVAGKENIMLDLDEGRFDHRSCHLSFTPDGCYRLGNPVTPLRDMKTLRTFLTVTRRTYLDWFESGVRGICDSNAIPICSFNVDLICSHLIRLRVLYLNPLTFYTLPNTLSNLLHLRDLDLSGNQKLIALPNSITELYNLEVLNLDGTSIRELPQNTRKLVNLRHLFLRHCKFLTHMPPGLNHLRNLHTLTTFVVGKGTFMQGKPRDLNALVNLRGELSIIFNKNSSCDLANYQQMEFLGKNHVTELNVQFSDQGAIHETLLDRLQPHSRLKGLQIESYEAFKLPGWAESLTSSLPNLVKIHLVKFDSLEILPSLSELRHLKYLKLKAIPNVEFMENDVGVSSNDELLFFPSLEELELSELPKLKGWWRDERRRVAGEVGSSSMVVPTFSTLLDLVLTDCPSLTHLPSCPSLCILEVRRCHEALTLLENNEAVQGPTSSLSSGIPLLEMYSLTLDNVEAFHYLFGETHKSIWSLRIQGFEGNNLSTLAKKCVRCVSSLKELKFLEIWDCPKLKSLSGALKQLTNLQGLTIGKCENLELENNEEQATMMSWESLHLLSYLRLHDLPKLVYLPQEFQYLTSLRSLSTFKCENLEALPEWINCLTSLQTLTIYKCDKLKSLPEAIAHMPALNTLEIRKCESLERRCRKPDGEDWPKVRHICLNITPVE